MGGAERGRPGASSSAAAAAAVNSSSGGGGGRRSNKQRKTDHHQQQDTEEPQTGRTLGLVRAHRRGDPVDAAVHLGTGAHGHPGTLRQDHRGVCPVQVEPLQAGAGGGWRVAGGVSMSRGRVGAACAAAAERRTESEQPDGAEQPSPEALLRGEHAVDAEEERLAAQLHLRFTAVGWGRRCKPQRWLRAGCLRAAEGAAAACCCCLLLFRGAPGAPPGALKGHFTQLVRALTLSSVYWRNPWVSRTGRSTNGWCAHVSLSAPPAATSTRTSCGREGGSEGWAREGA